MAARTIRWSAIVAALAAFAPVASAQRPEGAEQLSRQAVADSLIVLAALEKEASANPADAAIQHRIGRIAYTLVLRSLVRDTVPGLDQLKLRTIAHDALSRAVNLDGNRIDYLLTYASYLTREGRGREYTELAAQLIRRANEIAAADPSPEARARILLQMGDGAWFDYERSLIDTLPLEGFVDQVPTRTRLDHPDEVRKPGSSPENHRPRPGVVGGGPGAESRAVLEQAKDDVRPAIRPINGAIGELKAGPRSILEAAGGTKGDGTLQRTLAAASMRAIERLSRRGDDKATEQQERFYLMARMFYDSAYSLVPGDARAWRAVSKVRLEKNMWSDVQDFAADYTKRAPEDQWGWMALGLARQRLRATQNARIAFDSGLARMPSPERMHLDRVDRLMRPSDVPAYRRADSAGRASYDKASWFLADPLWSVDAEEPRLEFLARITHAEVRWGKLNPRLYGADTPDGVNFVRYGPAVKRLNNILLYPGGIITSTCGIWGGTLCALVRNDQPLMQRMYDWQPARWDNIAQIDIDSMPVQAARFRMGADSVDFFLATRAPVAKLDSVATNNVSPFAKFWIYGWNSPDVLTDSAGLAADGFMQWTRRLKSGMYNYRVEAVMPGTLAAGRAAANIVAGTDTITGFSMLGFGMSDLLLASSATMNANARRWNDVDFVPSLGTIKKGGAVSVVWENYEIARRGNDAEYHVTMTLAREETFGGRMSLDIIDGIRSVVRRSSKTNEIALDYDRLVPHAPTIVDNLTLSFGNTPEGAYYLTIAITDKVSGRTTSRTTRVVIQGK